MSEEQPQAPHAPHASEASWGYPSFAKDFPRHPELDALLEAFTRGDYRAVREGTPKLLESAADEGVKTAVRTLRARVDPDPASKILFLLAAGLLAILTLWWVSHSGSNDPHPPLRAKPASSTL